jgi:hypothetical protein
MKTRSAVLTILLATALAGCSGNPGGPSLPISDITCLGYSHLPVTLACSAAARNGWCRFQIVSRNTSILEIGSTEFVVPANSTLNESVQVTGKRPGTVQVDVIGKQRGA